MHRATRRGTGCSRRSRIGDDELLAQTLVGGLDIARAADQALERWQGCLDLIGETEEVERAIGTGEHARAMTRFNRYGPLLELGKPAEAKEVLEGCLDAFRQAQDVTCEARALSALAYVWDDLGDVGQAIDMERAALAVHDRLPNPGDRADSHHNLSTYLHKAGYGDQAKDHQLADLVYTMTAKLDMRISLQNLANRIHQASTHGERFDLPGLADLLARPAFAPLHTFLAERGHSVKDLQPEIDALIEQARAAAR
jgi:tetratricopeptide (TPR) repeat protein